MKPKPRYQIQTRPSAVMEWFDVNVWIFRSWGGPRRIVYTYYDGLLATMIYHGPVYLLGTAQRAKDRTKESKASN